MSRTSCPPGSRRRRRRPSPCWTRCARSVRCAVVATHVAFHSAFYSDTRGVGRLVARLDVGVAIFFVLSGFLLARPWLAAACAGQPHPHPAPLPVEAVPEDRAAGYLVVALAALALIDENAGRGPRGRLGALTMTDTYVSEHCPLGLTHMWSLATEVAFYVVAARGDGSSRRPRAAGTAPRRCGAGGPVGSPCGGTWAGPRGFFAPTTGTSTSGCRRT